MMSLTVTIVVIIAGFVLLILLAPKNPNRLVKPASTVSPPAEPPPGPNNPCGYKGDFGGGSFTPPTSSRLVGSGSRLVQTQPAPTAPPQWGNIDSIEISLPYNRNFQGWIRCLDNVGNTILGPFQILGTANPRLQANNRLNGRLYPFGDTPLGVYEITRKVRKALVLKPITGECALAEANGRTMILIHGAANLRYSSDGSLQMITDDLANIISIMPFNFDGTIKQRIRVIIREELEVDEFGEESILTNIDPDAMANLYYEFYNELGIVFQQIWQNDQDAVNALDDLGYTTQPDEPPYQEPAPVIAEPAPVPEPLSCAPSMTGYCPPPADPDALNLTGYVPPDQAADQSSWAPVGQYER